MPTPMLPTASPVPGHRSHDADCPSLAGRRGSIPAATRQQSHPWTTPAYRSSTSTAVVKGALGSRPPRGSTTAVEALQLPVGRGVLIARSRENGRDSGSGQPACPCPTRAEPAGAAAAPARGGRARAPLRLPAERSAVVLDAVVLAVALDVPDASIHALPFVGSLGLLPSSAAIWRVPRPRDLLADRRLQNPTRIASAEEAAALLDALESEGQVRLGNRVLRGPTVRRAASVALLRLGLQDESDPCRARLGSGGGCD